MNLAFQPAKQQDADTIYEQASALIQRYEDASVVNIPAALAWTEEKIRREITGYTCVLLDGETVAYYCLNHTEQGTELDDFYVLPQYRRQGIGTKILETLLPTVHGPVFLYVFNENAPAISLYTKMGFSFAQMVSKTRSILVRNG